MYKMGDVITVTVIGIRKYGLFVVDEHGRKGLIHVSECDNTYIKDLRNEFEINQIIKAIVMEDDGKDKFALSIRAMKETKGDIKNYPKPINLYVKHRHQWTNGQHEIGFEPLKESLNGWIRDKIR